MKMIHRQNASKLREDAAPVTHPPQKIHLSQKDLNLPLQNVKRIETASDK